MKDGNELAKAAYYQITARGEEIIGRDSNGKFLKKKEKK